jgi:hypothetical protein
VRIGILGGLVAGVAFLAVLVPLLYVDWFLPNWLGIHDDDLASVVGTAAWGLGIFLAISAWNLITHAFRRRNLAKDEEAVAAQDSRAAASCAPPVRARRVPMAFTAGSLLSPVVPI